jgi:hypothetical protein
MAELTRRPAAVVYDRVAAVYAWYTAPMEALGGRRFDETRALLIALGWLAALGVAAILLFRRTTQPAGRWLAT